MNLSCGCSRGFGGDAAMATIVVIVRLINLLGASLELVADLLGADLEDESLPAVAELDDGLLVAASLPTVDLPAVADDLVWVLRSNPLVRSVGHHCIYHAHVGFMVASFSGDRKKYLGDDNGCWLRLWSWWRRRRGCNGDGEGSEKERGEERSVMMVNSSSWRGLPIDGKWQLLIMARYNYNILLVVLLISKVIYIKIITKYC